MDADLHAVLGISKLGRALRTRDMIEGVLTQSFVQSNPALVRMLQSPDLDSRVVKAVVERLASIRAGTLDLHDASVAVGQILVNTYVAGSSVRGQHAAEQGGDQA